MAKQFYGRIDLRSNEALRFRMENRSDYPTDAKLAQLFYHVTEKDIKFCVDEVGNTALPGKWGTVSENIFTKQGSEHYDYNAEGEVITVTTTLPGGVTRIESITYVDGDPDIVVVSIPSLGISMTQTVVKNAEGDIIDFVLS